MSEITVRKNPSSLANREYEPFRTMRSLLRWDPFAEIAPAWTTETMLTQYWPNFEIKATKNSYTFKADVPGVKEADLEVTLNGNRLSVNAKREEEKEERGDTYYANERIYGTFTRSFTLPDDANVEQLHAELSTGVLTIAVPKKAEAQTKRIPVKAGEKSIKA